MLRPMFRAGASVSRLLSTEAVAVSDSAETGERRLKKIGRALETYLRNSKDHVAMMARERADFELGKRHLANMMGIDPHAVTQHDIDRAIEYLFPSGLSDLKARPVMKPPDEILPRFHRFTFDDEGRPHGSRFYTLNSKFYGLLSEVGVKTHNIGRFYFERVTLRDRNDADLQTASLSGTTWLSEEKMRKKIGEKISTEMYTQLLMAFEHLASLPGSAIENEFIGEFREPLASGTTSRLFGPDVPTVEICPQTNRRLATVRTRVKGTHATVSVRDAGTGQWEVDGQPLYTFRSLLAREILLCPLIVADLLGRVDVVAQSEGFGGETAVPRAVRHGTALCIAALFPETSERLRLAGLLTSDPRKKERSKVNQPGARAKWIWKRR